MPNPIYPPTTVQRRADAEAEMTRQREALRRTYLNGQTTWRASPWDSVVSPRLSIAREYQENNFGEQAEQTYADVLHEHGDSAFVHLDYAYYLARYNGGVHRAIEFLTQSQFQASQDALATAA